jgi:hypothetical protein
MSELDAYSILSEELDAQVLRVSRTASPEGSQASDGDESGGGSGGGGAEAGAHELDSDGREEDERREKSLTILGEELGSFVSAKAQGGSSFLPSLPILGVI